MRDVHGLSFTSIGLVSALPQVFLLFVTMGAALLADRLRTRKRRPLSSRTVRRALTALGLGLNALFFVALTPMRESVATAAVIFILAYSLLGFPVGGGYGVNHLDIAPRAAGVIVGISNTWGSVAGACAPVVMGWLTPFPLGRSRDSFDDGSAGKPRRLVSIVWTRPPTDAVVATAAGEVPADWVETMSAEWGRVFIFVAVMDAVGIVGYLTLGQGRPQRALDPSRVRL